jgi:transcriptional regulator with XRE-family HTH domain
MAGFGRLSVRGMAQRPALASRLAELRQERRLTQAVIAAGVGVTVSHISNMETGRDRPSVAMLRRLAGVLSVSYNELALLAGYMDPETELDAEAAADREWFAALPVELRMWLRRVAETYPDDEQRGTRLRTAV